MTPAVLLTVALAILLCGAVSKRLSGTPVTLPMVFVAVGLVTGPALLGLIEAGPESELFKLLGELTLVIVLFTDASRIQLSLLIRQHDLPIRLLLAGLPLTVAAGWLTALWLLPGTGLWTAALVAAVLAPTDAALGQAVVSDRRIPVRMRQTLNVESGLNDGLVLPAVIILLSCLGAEAHSTPARDWLHFAALQIIVGPLVGALVGLAGARLVSWGHRSGWMSQAFQQLAGVALALAAFSLSELGGGNGFIAAFVAGLVIGNQARRFCRPLYDFAEAEGQLMTLLVFLVFGAVMAPAALSEAGRGEWAYALLSLTLIRTVPVLVSLAGSGLRLRSKLFLCWFGPRGIASILFLILVVEEMVPEAGQISTVVSLTVLLSVLLHGATAAPLARGYGTSLRAEKASPEHRPVDEMPLRLGRAPGRE